MSAASKRPATYEDLLAVPDTKVAEIVKGVLYVSPRPAVPHARAASALGSKIGGPFDHDARGPGGWVILFEPELHFRGDVLVPDLAGWRRARMPKIPKGPFIDLAPDWCCEVSSPSTQKLDRAEKMDVYAREGVAHLWIVDPIAKILDCYRLEHEKWLRVGTWRDDDKARIEPFDAIELDLAAMWIDD